MMKLNVSVSVCVLFLKYAFEYSSVSSDEKQSSSWNSRAWITTKDFIDTLMWKKKKITAQRINEADPFYEYVLMKKEDYGNIFWSRRPFSTLHHVVFDELTQKRCTDYSFIS